MRSRNNVFWHLTFLAGFYLLSTPVWSCSAFNLSDGNESIVGKSYDWHMGHGYFLTNKRNVKKESMAFIPGDVGFSWISKYGSLTFNQYAHELPNGGMNEEGLVVEILVLDRSVYPRADERESLNELQWIQYSLDNFSSVKEMITQVKKKRVSSVHGRVHYFACDKFNECAVFEYLNGRLVINSTLDNMPIRSITNNSYEDSVKYSRNFIPFGGERRVPQGQGSGSRFVRASALIQEYNGQTPINIYSFDVLRKVAMGDYTKWNIVYNITKRSIHYVNKKDSSQKFSFKLADVDFSCANPVMGINLQEVHPFKIFTVQKNKELVKKSFQNILPASFSNKIAVYPMSVRCQE